MVNLKRSFKIWWRLPLLQIIIYELVLLKCSLFLSLLMQGVVLFFVLVLIFFIIYVIEPELEKEYKRKNEKEC